MQFFLDARSGTSPYLQLVEQVRWALRVGNIHVGDQLPTIKEVVATLAINPNTVLKAYRQLENEGLIETRPGVGTFILRTLGDPTDAAMPELRDRLAVWLEDARRAGVEEDTIVALFQDARRTTLVRGAV